MGLTPKLEALSRRVATIGDAAVDARARPPITERLATLRAEQDRRRKARSTESLRWPVAIGVALGVAASALLFMRASPDPSLTFAVGEPTTAGQDGAWLTAPPARALPVTFSDGTRLRLEGGARARVFEVGPHGARVAIERGVLRADVVPRPGNAWSIVGGPFEIQVTGTSFDAAWDPEREALHVTMHEGHVVVRAACLDHARALATGDAVTLSCLDARAALAAPSPSAPSPAASLAPSPAPTLAPSPAPTLAEPSSPPSADPAVAPAPSDAASTWRDRARAGDYQGALAAAEAADFSALTGTLSAADLLELGTTARLASARPRAIQAYTTLRARFAGSDPAATAAFHLGQLAFDGAHAYAEARSWFTAYLTERPGGALASEALGRSLECAHRLGDTAAAEATARHYLALYPTGAHAALARSLVTP